MTREEAEPILYAMACAKRARAMELRAAGEHSGVQERAALIDQEATAIDLAIEALGFAGEPGWVLVPIKPTRAMIQAGETGAADGIDETRDSVSSYHIIDENRIANGVWREMIAAVPALTPRS